MKGRICGNAFILCFILLLSASTIRGDWELKSRNGQWDRSINQVHFITPQQGWAAGNGSTFWTEDGGETWTRRDLDIWPTAFFLNSLDGWQYNPRGEQFSISGTYPPVGVLIPFERSSDGGLTWTMGSGVITEVVELTPQPPGGQVLADPTIFRALAPTFYFLDMQTGFAAGTTVLYGTPDVPGSFRAFYIANTVDGGQTWRLHLHWGEWGTLQGSITQIEFDDFQHGRVLTALSVLSYEPLTQTLWASGNFETLYRRDSSVVSVSPRGKLPLTWGQLKR